MNSSSSVSGIPIPSVDKQNFVKISISGRSTIPTGSLWLVINESDYSSIGHISVYNSTSSKIGILSSFIHKNENCSTIFQDSYGVYFNGTETSFKNYFMLVGGLQLLITGIETDHGGVSLIQIS